MVESPEITTGECKNKSDEDAIMRREVMLLRTILASPKLEKAKMKEYLIRLMYVEMLGHDASFGYINAVKATHESDLSMKRVGYLATSAFLDEHHDLIILIVNTVQQDLKNDNYLVVCAALTTVCRLVNEETIPAVLPQVVDLLTHPKEHVRKKAVMALHRFHQRSPSSVAHLHGKFRQMLCDKDPSVMSAALCTLHDLIVLDPAPHKNLVPSFVSILKQIVEHRLPKSYDYHRVPAPFIQIKLLKILAALGTADKSASTEMYSVLSTTLKKGDNQINIGNAIVYECVRTAATIYPSPVLLEHCASVVSRFVKSPNNNLRYIGLDSLSCIVNINPKYALEHQMAVVDCLEDPDESLRKKTLDLLYRMTKSHNVEVIVEKMTEFLRSATDRHTREETVSRISELAERYAPNTQWFIDTMNAVFAIGGDVVKPATAHNLMRLIGEGSGDDAADDALRGSAVAAYLDLLSSTPKLPKVLLEVIFWVVGEYGTLSGKSAVVLMDILCTAVEKQPEGDNLQAQAMTACAKLAAAGASGASGAGGCQLSEKAVGLLERNVNSSSVDRQQRAYEITALLREGADVVAAALPPDASCEDLEVDPALPSLDAYVTKALTEGASPYQPPSERSTAGLRGGAAATSATWETGGGGASGTTVGSLRFDAYDAPSTASHAGGSYDPYIPKNTVAAGGAGTAAAAAATGAGASEEPRLNRKEGTWGASSGLGGGASHPSSSASTGPGGTTAGGTVQAAPQPKDDRALLADALFSGAKSSPAASPASASQAPKAVPPPPASVAATPAPPSDMDLLMGLDAPTPAAASSSSAGAASGVDDLLSQLSVGGGNQAPTPTPATSSAFNLNSLYGSQSGQQAMQQQGQQQQQQQGMSGMMGGFPGMTMGMSGGGAMPGMMSPHQPQMGGILQHPQMQMGGQTGGMMMMQGGGMGMQQPVMGMNQMGGMVPNPSPPAPARTPQKQQKKNDPFADLLG